MRRLYRFAGGVITAAVVSVAVIVVVAAILAIESEVRGGQALDKLQLTIHGPDEGTDRQRRAARERVLCAGQMDPVEGDVAANLEAIEALASEARGRRCELLVLPEMATVGHDLGEAVWDAAEPADGSTVAALSRVARRHRLTLVTSVPERSFGEIYETGVVLGRDGSVVTSRKLSPTWSERARFVGGAGPSVVETPLGTMGIALGADAFRRDVFAAMLDGDPDLVVVPAAVPVPEDSWPGLRFYTAEEWHALPHFYADLLGVPVVTAQAAGRVDYPLPFGDPPATVPCQLAGNSRIVSTRSGVDERADPRSPGLVVARVTVGRLGRQDEVSMPGDYLVTRPLLFGAWTWLLESRAAARYHPRIDGDAAEDLDHPEGRASGKGFRGDVLTYVARGISAAGGRDRVTGPFRDGN